MNSGKAFLEVAAFFHREAMGRDSRLIEPDSGEIRFAGQDLLSFDAAHLRAARRQMQMVFQDPFASLDPRMRVGELVEEPLTIHERSLSKTEKWQRTAAMLERVGMSEEAVQRYPHEFSGGQRQRIGIARANPAAETGCCR